MLAVCHRPYTYHVRFFLSCYCLLLFSLLLCYCSLFTYHARFLVHSARAQVFGCLLGMISSARAAGGQRLAAGQDHGLRAGRRTSPLCAFYGASFYCLNVVCLFVVVSTVRVSGPILTPGRGPRLEPAGGPGAHAVMVRAAPRVGGEQLGCGQMRSTLMGPLQQ